MRLNGQVLKWTFIVIIASLCVVMIMSTYEFLSGKVTLDAYKSILELLGIPTLIGMIVQGFLHYNQADSLLGDPQTAVQAPSAAPVSPTDDSKASGLAWICLLGISCLMASGCASAGLNGFCGRVSGEGLTVPYIGGKANTDGYACHVGCVGMGCPKPDYSSLVSVMDDYSKMETTQGKILTQGPGTVVFTPTK